MTKIWKEPSIESYSKAQLESQLESLYSEIRDCDFHSIEDENLKMAYFASYQGQFFKIIRENNLLCISLASKKAGISCEVAENIESGNIVPDVDTTKDYINSVGASFHIYGFLELFEN